MSSQPLPPGLNRSQDGCVRLPNHQMGDPTLDPSLAFMSGPGNVTMCHHEPSSQTNHLTMNKPYYHCTPSNTSSTYPVQHHLPRSSVGSSQPHGDHPMTDHSAKYWGSLPIANQFALPHLSRSNSFRLAGNPPSNNPVGDRPANPPPQALQDGPPKAKRHKRGTNRSNNVDCVQLCPPAKPRSQATRKPRAKKPGDLSAPHGKKVQTLPTSHPPPASAPSRSAVPNAPCADGRHHPHPVPQPTDVIAVLEGAVSASENSTTASHPAPSFPVPSPTIVPLHRPTPPLEGISNPRPKKNLKHLRSREENGLGALPTPQPYDELMRKSIGNLVAHAQEGSKGAMSDDDRSFFVEFQAEQRRALAIKAIERGVSVAMVDKYLGQCLAMRNISDWNLFLKTEPAREKFRGAGKGGIAQHHPMAEIGAMWEDIGKKLPPDFAIDGRPADRLTSSERALDDNVGDSDPTASRNNALAVVSPPTLRGTVSMSTAAGQVQDFLDRWVHQANRVAQTCKCEMILFTVSKYLGADSYSLATTTHGATAFANLANKLDGQNTYATRFHAWAVGHSAEHIASLADPEEALVNRPRSLKFTERISRLLARKTEGVLTQWPWTNCEVKLAKAGFRLKLDPRLRINIAGLSKPSSTLLANEIRKLHLDLDDKYIDVVRMSPGSSCSTASSRSQSPVSSLRDSSESSLQSSLRSSSGFEHQPPASPIHPPSPSALGSLQDAEYSDYSSDSSENLPPF
ncbi:hypothetical protein KEM48_007840 [Puccinia striiformis f. sp. tritici PST-130]|nr:hypothetical protein KEM48_007840 [Puccinia striiformis f. sp. tritici PST-130]